jgi:hypothetical protein
MQVRHAAWFMGLLAPLSLHAQQPASKASTLSKADYIAAAQKAAPASISENAAVIRLEHGGKITKYRDGTNGFTCLFGLPGDPEEAPVCADANAMQWLSDAMSGKPTPTNAVPGIAYMGAGGAHYVNAQGESVMEGGADIKVVKEPPHWMVFAPFDPKTTGLSTRPTTGGAWIMFAGTPYSHLMIYQDPATILSR